ncbi:hypothetical protein ACHQM5_013448 [Ranunculus cassubicifolius]
MGSATHSLAFVVDRWLHLPEEIYEDIIKRLELGDLLRFSFVCQTWKSLVSSLLPPKLNPWLLVPYGGYKSAEGTVWDKNLGFCDYPNETIYRVEMPEIAGCRICGSCRGGWLITMHENGEIQLLHPFSRAVINLPQLTTLPGVAGSFIDENNDRVYDILTSYGNEDHRQNIISTSIREFYIYKAVMSSYNSRTGIVMAIYGLSRHLTFCRPGKDQTWTPLKGDVDGRFTDITFYKGKFYAVQSGGSVFVVDGLDTSSPFVRFFIASPMGCVLDKYYLIESLGEMLWIRRTRYKPGGVCDDSEEDPPSYETSDFQVRKLVVNVPKWVDVNDLGDNRALFVGYNDSFSLSTSDLPGFRGNSIYFTDDNLKEYTDQPFGGHDLGSYNINDGYVGEWYPADSNFIKPPPVWFTTNSS